MASPPAHVQNFEGELYGGITAAMFRNQYERIGVFDFGAELRYNIKTKPLAVGIFAEMYYPDRMFNHQMGTDCYNNGGGLYGVMGEYNFRRGKRCNPFVAAGFGLGNLHEMDGPTKCTPAFRIKGGVEFINHIRINASCTFSKRDLCGFRIGIGFVIGGRPKK